ncbi:MAG: proteasome accessory factor PafA2 family protein [Verrucomicrobiaceae bacterium]|nr:proteasome accessory factor PafA2 family protein [Verrucomicrobiaceae bacterium]
MNTTHALPPPVPPALKSKPKMVPKICGGDYEVANFIENDPTGSGDAARAAKLLLAEIEGVPWINRSCWSSMYPKAKKLLEIDTDRGRVFLPGNGGSIYIDLDHLELAMPEVRSCSDHEAAMRAMCMIAREAMKKANARLAPAGDERIRVRLNNTDGHGNSFGTHLNLLVQRDAFRRMTSGGTVSRFFASFCAATTVLGQGKVGSENERAPVSYQWSQRADFFSSTRIIGEDTQAPNRVVWNTRDESHCDDCDLARLHCIFYDHVFNRAAQLKVWLLQVAAAMEEARVAPVDITLAAPLAAVISWSHDLGLRHKARLLADHRSVTSAEWLAMFLDSVGRFLPELEGIVPESQRMFEMAVNTADLLMRRDYAALSSKLDAFAKLAIIRQTKKAHGLEWDAPPLKVIDQLYGSLDEEEGIIWQLEAAGAMETLVDPGRVAHFMTHPPADTRAAIRSKLLRLVDPADIRRVDWGELVFEADIEDRRRRVLLSFDPLNKIEPGSALDRATSQEDVIAAMNLSPSRPAETPGALVS